MLRIKEFFLLKILFPIVDVLISTRVSYWYKQISKMQNWSKEEIQDWQLSKLKILINHAYNNTVYYKEVFDNLNLKPSDIQSFDDLKKLPILTKQIIKSRFNDLMPSNINQIKHRHCATGGSSGNPLKFIASEDTWSYITANKIISWKKTGFIYGSLYVSLGSSSLFPVNKKSFIHEVYFRFRNTIPLNGMNMSDEFCQKYVKIIQKRNVKYIYGYPSAIYILAKYIKKHEIKLQMKGIFTTAEVLTPVYREMIESTLNLRVIDCYGARDGGITAFGIEQESLFVGYNSYCETLYYSDTASELYLTNLIDLSFPLIRYQLGDNVLLDKNNTNYNGQVIKKIEGRTSGIIELKNGRRISSPGFATVFNRIHVEAFRIKKINDLTVQLDVQKDEKFTDSDGLLVFEIMKKYCGDDCEIIFNYVDEFEPLKNGKRDFFIN